MNIGSDLFGAHHGSTLFGKLRLLARLRIKPGEFCNGRAEIIGFTGRRLYLCAVAGKLLLGVPP